MRLHSAVLLVALYLVSSQSSVIKLSPHAAAHFQRLMVTYTELFTSEEEKQERLQNFIAASKVIDAHNEGPNGRYFQLEHNRMSLLSAEEKSAMLGRISSLSGDRKLSTTTSTTTSKKLTTATTKKPTTTTNKKLTTTTTKKPTTTTTKKPTTTTTKKPTTSTTKKPTTTKFNHDKTTKSTNKPSTSKTASTTPSTTTISTTSSPGVKGFDLRTSTLCGQLIPVKNQSQCAGSGWAFSTIAPIEWAVCNKSGAYFQLSEQKLISCDDVDRGCNGGNVISAMNWIQSNQSGDVATEASYPFTSGDGNVPLCLNNPSIVTVKLSSFTLLPCTANNGTSASVTDIENAIMNNGVVSACILNNEANSLFEQYASGVFVDPSCSSLMNGQCGQFANTNHCGSLVGWGFNSTLNIPYWIFRNQWGTNWGIGGYMNVQKGVNMCGIESQIVYAAVGSICNLPGAGC